MLDREGVELTDIAMVRKYAHRRAAQLAEAADQAEEISGWRIQICDENGIHVMSLPAEPELPGEKEPGSDCGNVHLNRKE